MDQNHLNNFERGSTKDHSCEIWSKSNQWFRRRCCLKIVNGWTDGRTDRRWRTVSDHNTSPWAFGSGELKTRGPWWSYITHLSKQLCILTVEVSAKFTALRFLFKFYSPAPQRPCFFSCIMMAWTESWKRITKGTILPRYIETSGFWPDLLPITYKCIRLQLQLLCNFIITDYSYNYIFPECNQLQLQLHCNVIDYNYNYFLVVPCLKKF